MDTRVQMTSRERLTERDLGLLSELALRQEEYRSLLQDLKKAEPDRTYLRAQEAASVTELDEDKLIALASVRYEMQGYAAMEAEDLIWAGELLDHLDTLGWRVERKSDAEG